MTDGDSDTEPTPATGPQPANGDISPCFRAYIVRNDHRPNVCTIYSDATVGSIETTWIKATGSAFVSLEDAR
ncbi:DUF7511 domain-containing protein [Natronorubrum halophilum]|uniref:DUF7511 domain-containing protein n=1 Tax=Natronorubrum halophilum TaxID=1702106 RepID=UPI000EF72A05|nr:hypothetical protein [Natronorubrum halophilum]